MDTQLPTIYPMIVAAGRGSRFGATIPKQYTRLLDKTLLEHSVAALSTCTYIERCLLVIASDDDRARLLNFALPVDYAIGGEERWQSVVAGLTHIIDSGAAADDLILIHDAARPAVSSNDITAVIDAAANEPYGAILAAPVADTLKKSDNHQSIDCTIDRNNLWQAFTPQVFRIGALKKVLDHVSAHKYHVTDEASAFEYLQLPIRLVNGSRQNIKLTYPEDLMLLTAILNTHK